MENIVNSTIALYKAYRKTRCGKRDNPTAMRYRMEAIERTVALSERLQRRDYSFGPYYPFKVYEPKERLVLAIDFEGKVVQHSLCDNVLEPAFSRRFIRDNYAGQIGKGTHDGLDRLAAAMRHYFFSRKAADEAAHKAAGLPPRPMNEWDYADGWVLKGDFSKFFYTLLHSYCYETARRALKWLKDPELIDFAEWLLWLIIDSTPDPGIPIGNQSSQLLALLYLDAFDHWLRDDRGLVYGRYMDDFYIINSDKLLLRQILKEIEAYIKPLGLRLNGKTQILPLKNGIDFLGFHTYAALLDLVTDICKRNGIKRLVWSTSKNDRVNHLNGCNMTVHRDYANKSCPGDYLYNRHGQIAAEVNKRLGVTDAGGSTSGQTSGSTETGLKVGDVVDFKGTQHYTSAAAKDAKTCKPGKATITAIAAGKAHPYHLKAVSGGGSTVYGWVNAADISTGNAGTATSYRARTTADVLNIRKGPGTNYGVAGQIKGKGIYTIVAEAAGPGATKWGKLKSGAGWISLDYVTKL